MSCIFDSVSRPSYQVQDLSQIRFKDGTCLSREVLKKIPENLKKNLQSEIEMTFLGQERELKDVLDGGRLAVYIAEKEAFCRDGVSLRNIGTDTTRMRDALSSVKDYARRVRIGPFKKYEMLPASSNSLSVEGYVRSIAHTSDHIVFNEVTGSEAGANMLAVAGLIVDSASFTRCVLTAAHEMGSSHQSVHNLRSYVVLPLLFLVSLYTMKRGIDETVHQSAIGDVEGKYEGIRRALEGFCVFSGSTMWGMTEFSVVSGAAASGVSFASGVTFGVAGLLGMGISLTNILRCRRFLNKLEIYSENQNLTEEERCEGSLNYLRDQVTISQDDLEIIFNEAREKGDTEEERQGLFLKFAKNCILTKVARFRRRAGKKSLRLILKNVDSILLKMKDPAQKLNAIREAKELIETVKAENRKRKIYYTLLFIASAVSFAAFVAGLVLTSGVLPLVLGTIAAGICVLLGLYGAGVYIRHKLNMQDSAYAIPIDNVVALESMCGINY